MSYALRMGKYDLVANIRDPVYFVQNVLGGNPWSKQQEILQSIRFNRDTNVKSCHSAGKSWLAARAALWFLYTHKPSLVITTAPSNKQVRGILWKEIRVAHSEAKVALGGRMLVQELQLGEGWSAIGFTAPNYDATRFQGFHERSTLVVVDEACGISPQVDMAIESILSGEDVRLLRIGNPTSIATPFAQSFRKESVSNFTISAFDTPNFTSFGILPEDIYNDTWSQKITGPLPCPTLVSPQWVYDRFISWGKDPGSPFWRSRVLAEFPTTSSNCLISADLIEHAANSELAPTYRRSFGVDVARYGEDETVVMLKDGPRANVVGSWRGHSTMETAGSVIQLIDLWRPEFVYIDTIGVGAGVVDRLMEHPEASRVVVPVNVSEPSSNRKQYYNRRTELFFYLQSLFIDKNIAIDPLDEELQSQLSTLAYKPHSSGSTIMESKDDMKRRGLSSPDRADALALACYGELSINTHHGLDLALDIGFRESPWRF